jgi:AcrR family transcriptional regulator
MSVRDRRRREYERRHREIIAAARAIAETDGWAAMTTRRLADRIEYSQPVLYSHFSGKEAIVAAVAVQGFEELAAMVRRMRAEATGPADALHAIAQAYLDFAREKPAVYVAMFELSTDLSFARGNSPQPLIDTFRELIAVMAEAVPDQDPETCAETVWSALHGLASLERNSRLRPSHTTERLAMLLDRFVLSG